MAKKETLLIASSYHLNEISNCYLCLLFNLSFFVRILY